MSSCGGKKPDGDGNQSKHDAGLPPGPTVAPLVMPQLGIDNVRRTNFIYGDGAGEYGKAAAAYNAKPRKWDGVQKACEAAIQKDPNHIQAHWLLGIALAQQGQPAAAVEHLVAALAADYWQYGPYFDKDDDLKDFLKTPHGVAVKELADKIKVDYAKRTAAGLWVVARRSSFRWPEKPGVQAGSTRGELYAFDREAHRYLRLTHTDHHVIGFVRSPSGGEVAVVGYETLDHPKDDAAPPQLRAWVELHDAADWTKALGPRATTEMVREVALGYAAGEQLLVATSPPAGRWGLGEVTVRSLDKATGKLSPVQSGLPTPRIAVNLDEGRVVRVPDGVKAAWSGEPPSANKLEVAGKPIGIPDGRSAAQSTVAVAPGGAYVAFATTGDPCAKGNTPALYVADSKGGMRHVLSGNSRFATRWLDATTLAYDDGEGTIRLWDAAAGRHDPTKLDNKPGIALDVLSLTAAPLCTQAPQAAGSGSGSGDELPPEEGSGGPVTTPR